MDSDDDADDSPIFKDIKLLDKNRAYKKCLEYVQIADDEKKPKIDVDIMYQAFLDLIMSEDDNKADGIDYLIEGGLPRAFQNKEPLVLIAAKRLKDKKLLDMLIVFRYHHFDFDECNQFEESATKFLTENCPSILVALNKINLIEYFLGE